MFHFADSESSTEGGTPPDRNDLPIVEVAEPHRVLYQLIYHCYQDPVNHTTIHDVTELAPVFEAADKYEMPRVITSLKATLEHFEKDHPLPVFALACRFGPEDLARSSALKWRARLHASYVDSPKAPHGFWKDMTVASSFVPEMNGMCAGVFYRLAEYLRTGVERPFSKPTSSCKLSDSEVPRPTVTFQMTQYPDADIRIQSYHSQATFFHVHKIILSTSSPVLMQKIDELSESSSEDLPTLSLPEHDNILQIILASCYSSMLADMPSFELADLPELGRAAQHYRLINLVNLCRQSMTAHIIADPLKAYLIAADCGWKAEAREAAVRLAQRAKEGRYSPYLELVDTSIYFPLLKFCHEYRRVIFQVTGGCKGRTPEEMWAAAEWICDEMPGDAGNLAWAFAMYLMESGHRNKTWSELRTMRDDLISKLAQIQLEI
ncbi:hypothetical protein QCA50_019886 [Cerrena zonata]|uniref:BTB domain-containing protein n=1 Tax=Cerrena zonata TaxID=2478898 RepID=A0AAW0FDF5_9APHY